MAESPVPSISPDEVRLWLWQHIPFRVTAAIAGTSICDEWAAAEPPLGMPIGLRLVCLNDAAYQGQISAVRWLIEFVGLQEDRKRPVPAPSFAANAMAHGKPTTDFGIGMLPGGRFHATDSRGGCVSRAYLEGMCAVHFPSNTRHEPSPGRC